MKSPWVSLVFASWLVVAWSLRAGGETGPGRPDADPRGVRVAPSAERSGLSVAPVTAEAPERNAGLFVGINEFTVDQSLRPLALAVNDALAQANLFVIELRLLPAQNCFLAISGSPTSDSAKAYLEVLTRAGVRQVKPLKANILQTLLAVEHIPESPANLLVVSFSSHGFEDGGTPYVMPADGLRGILEDTAINLNTVEQRLARSKAGKRLLIIDACRENPTTDGRGGDKPMTTQFRTALAQAEGQAVLASCDAGQLSYENPSLGHGVFTYYLLEALRGRATADSRGFITLGTVCSYVAESVPAWIVRNKPELPRNSAQRPWFKGPKVAEEIPLAMDPGVREAQSTFKADIARTIEALKVKIQFRGKFTPQHYTRLAEALERAEPDAEGQDMLANARKFLEDKIPVSVFVAYINSLPGDAREGGTTASPAATETQGTPVQAATTQETAAPTSAPETSFVTGSTGQSSKVQVQDTGQSAPWTPPVGVVTSPAVDLNQSFRHPIGFSVRYPKEWKTQETTMGLQFSPPDLSSNAFGPLETYFADCKVVPAGEYGSAQVTVELLNGLMTQWFPFLVNSGAKAVKIGKHSASETTWDGEHPTGIAMQGVLRAVTIRGFICFVAAVAEPQRLRARDPILKSIFAAMDLGEPIRDPQLVGVWSQKRLNFLNVVTLRMIFESNGTYQQDMGPPAGMMSCRWCGSDGRVYLMLTEGTGWTWVGTYRVEGTRGDRRLFYTRPDGQTENWKE